MFGLPTGGSVTDGNGFYGILFHQFGDFPSGKLIFAFGRMGINRFGVEQGTLRSKTHHLAARAISGVYSHYPFLSQGRSEQQLPQIFGKYPDGFCIGFLFAERGEFRFYLRFQQALVGITDSFCNLMSTFVITAYIHPFEPFTTFIVVRADGHFQQTFRFSPADGEQAV